MRQGEFPEAERVALRAAQRLDPGLLVTPHPDQVGVSGSLLFNAASAAARGGNPNRADEILRVANAAAVRDGQDRTGEAGVFGPRVAGMRAVDQAVRSGRPGRAFELPRRIRLVTGTVPAFWEAGHRLHLAAAAVDLEQWGNAIELLERAAGLARQWVRVPSLEQVVLAQLLGHWAFSTPVQADLPWCRSTRLGCP